VVYTIYAFVNANAGCACDEKLFRIKSNIYLNQVALFDEAGKKDLYLATPQDTGSNSFMMPWTFSGKTCEVSCTTLDEYLKMQRIHHVDIAKIDIEGSELPALLGG
jgi:FkbM family methyltransferase